jgi:hypothetical protein
MELLRIRGFLAGGEDPGLRQRARRSAPTRWLLSLDKKALSNSPRMSTIASPSISLAEIKFPSRMPAGRDHGASNELQGYRSDEEQ